MRIPPPLTHALDGIFNEGWKVECNKGILVGEGKIGEVVVALIGTVNTPAISVEIALELSEQVLQVIEKYSKRPIFLLVDNSGQKLSLRDEMLGSPKYLAHLASCIALARNRHHTIIALLHGSGVSGGFMVTGLAADLCFALVDTEVRVMRVDAMARITRISREKLEYLLETSSVLTPTTQAFVRLGAIESVLTESWGEVSVALVNHSEGDHRDLKGKDRGGRIHASDIAKSIVECGRRRI